MLRMKCSTSWNSSPPVGVPTRIIASRGVFLPGKNVLKLESSLQSVGRREGLTGGEIDWEVSATEKDG